jgi:hypothetical protein
MTGSRRVLTALKPRRGSVRWCEGFYPSRTMRLCAAKRGTSGSSC